jgi:hypothetical protein
MVLTALYIFTTQLRFAKLEECYDAMQLAIQKREYNVDLRLQELCKHFATTHQLASETSMQVKAFQDEAVEWRAYESRV